MEKLYSYVCKQCGIIRYNTKIPTDKVCKICKIDSDNGDVYIVERQILSEIKEMNKNLNSIKQILVRFDNKYIRNM